MIASGDMILFIDQEGLIMHQAILSSHWEVTHPSTSVVCSWTGRFEYQANAHRFNISTIDQVHFQVCHAQVGTSIRHDTV